jgi:hypothetical protein
VRLTENLAWVLPITIAYLLVLLALLSGSHHFRRDRYE